MLSERILQAAMKHHFGEKSDFDHKLFFSKKKKLFFVLVDEIGTVV